MRASEFTIGWVCPLAHEFAAARAMLDTEFRQLPPRQPGDGNSYAGGTLAGHNIILATLPAGKKGTGAAAIVANDLRRSFTAIRFALLVGIGAGVPAPDRDIRLGDVVVSRPAKDHGGLIHYDMGKFNPDGSFERRGHLNEPPALLLAHVQKLEAYHQMYGPAIRLHLDRMFHLCPTMKSEYDRPTPEELQGQRKPRICPDGTADLEPQIFYGLIASGDKVIANAERRDHLRKVDDVYCFEMEAAGFSNALPGLVIRGISDYADGHKNDSWQKFAAATAAAYARDLLRSIPASDVQMLPASIEQHAEARFENLPRNRVGRFFGRETILSAIDERFRIGQCALSTTVTVILAMGGQGKTQVTLEYCHRHLKDYQNILWIDATTEKTAQASFSNILNMIDDQAESSQYDDKMKAKIVLDSLQDSDDPWLMVFDGYDSPSEFANIRDYFPSGTSGHIIVSSRHQGAASLGHRVDLPSLAQDGGLQLLEKDFDEQQRAAGPDISRQIVDRLGGLALAVEQASAYISHRQVHPNTFLREYESSKARILSMLGHTREDLWEYKRTDASTMSAVDLSALTTWEMSLASLEPPAQASDASKTRFSMLVEFLTSASFLGSSNITREVFQTLHEDPELGDKISWMQLFVDPAPSASEDDTANAQWSNDKFWGLLKSLSKVSLIQGLQASPQPTFSLHAVIRDWLQVRQLATVQQRCSNASRQVLKANIRRFPFATASLTERTSLLLHCEECIKQTRHVLRLPEDWYEFNSEDWPDFSNFFVDCSKYDWAIVTQKHIYRSFRRNAGLCDSRTIAALSELVRFLQWDLRLSEAIPAAIIVVRYQRILHGPHNWRSIEAQCVLAKLYSEARRIAEAREINEALYKKRSNLDQETALTIANALALSYWDLGRFNDCLNLQEQTLRECIDCLGETHTLTMSVRRHIVPSLVTHGQIQRAFQMSKQVLDWHISTVGQYHRDTLDACYEHADVLKAAGFDLGKVIAMRKEQLHMKRVLLNPLDYDIVKEIVAIAECEQDMGNFEAAKSGFQEAIQLTSEASGPDHPDLIPYHASVVTCFEKACKNDDAVALLRDTVALSKRAKGSVHFQTLRLQDRLAQKLIDIGRFEETEAELLVAIQARSDAFGPNHASVMSSQDILASLYANTEKYEKAVSLREQVVQRCSAENGVPDYRTLAVRTKLCANLVMADRWKAAGSMMEELLPQIRRVFAKDQCYVREAERLLARVYVRLERFADATILLEPVLEFLIDSEKPNSKRRQACTRLLQSAYNQAGRHEDAEKVLFRQINDLSQMTDSCRIERLESQLSLAEVFMAHDKWKDAANLLHFLAPELEALGRGHLVDYIFALTDWARSLWETGHSDEAEKRSRAAVEKARLHFGPDHPLLLECEHQLARNLRRFHSANVLKLSQAEQSWQQVVRIMKLLGCGTPELWPNVSAGLAELKYTLERQGLPSFEVVQLQKETEMFVAMFNVQPGDLIGQAVTYSKKYGSFRTMEYELGDMSQDGSHRLVEQESREQMIANRPRKRLPVRPRST